MKRLLLYLFGAYAALQALLSLWRVFLFVALRPALAGTAERAWPAFVRGLWFDNVAVCYVLLLPLVAVAFCAVTGRGRRSVLRPVGVWTGTGGALLLTASAANVPYFCYFSKVLNSSVWQWFAYPSQTAGMLLGEASWTKFVVGGVASIAVLAVVLRALRLRTLRGLPAEVPPSGVRLRGLAVWLPLLGLCVLGMRGRTGYNPIKVSAAYYCDNALLNQLGVNPAFALLQTTLDDRRKENRTLRLMRADRAVRNVQRMLGRTGLPGISPLAREVRAKGAARRLNVVLVLMESMSARLMGRFGHGGRLTPVLDSLFGRGLSFANCYSAGNHTNHGLYATLWSFPSILKRNAMKGSNVPLYDGLPSVLRKQGYRTLFFMTHEAQYDNMNAFLRTNGYEEIFSQEDYPRKEVVNHFGVPDDYLFRYALPVLDERAASGRPFFATLLTISNHPPYVIPADLHPRSGRPEEQIVEYADRSIGRFMAAAARRPWFRNTIFVFLGDHGKNLGEGGYEIAESFNHIPLIFYAPGLIAPEMRTDFAGQVDVAPTLLGLLNVSYVQNNFGIDLTRERRPAIFYTADNVVAARNERYLYIYNPEAEREFCYDVSTEAFRPLSARPLRPELRELKRYVFSNLQAAESLVQQGLTRDHRP